MRELTRFHERQKIVVVLQFTTKIFPRNWNLVLTPNAAYDYYLLMYNNRNHHRAETELNRTTGSATLLASHIQGLPSAPGPVVQITESCFEPPIRAMGWPIVPTREPVCKMPKVQKER